MDDYGGLRKINFRAQVGNMLPILEFGEVYHYSGLKRNKISLCQKKPIFGKNVPSISYIKGIEREFLNHRKDLGHARDR